MKILLAEDEDGLRDVIRINLEIEGYDVVTASSGTEADQLLKVEKPDLLLLDVMMPGKDGFEICREVRGRGEIFPIIFITARGESEDRIRGLKTGGDDYLVKPFHLEELLLRISNLLRRSAGTVDEFNFGDNSIRFRQFLGIDKNGKQHNLSKKETDFLRLLVNRKNEVVSRDEILNFLWPEGDFPSPRVIDNYVLVFRKIFEKDGEKYFHSVRGVGYKFTPGEVGQATL